LGGRENIEDEEEEEEEEEEDDDDEEEEEEEGLTRTRRIKISIKSTAAGEEKGRCRAIVVLSTGIEAMK
jgi:CO dehydrogenase/acetyl-CoA synthase beta subunit